MIQTIMVDSGKSITKAITQLHHQFYKLQFRTKVQESQNLGVDLSPNNYWVEYEGTQYLIGDMVSEGKTDSDLTKTNISHRLSIYLAIVLFLEKAEIDFTGIPLVNLGVNTPTTVYKNLNLKEEYRNFLLNDHRPIALRVNGKAMMFKIQELIALPEGMGSVFTKMNDFRNQRLMVWDIGSLNVNIGVYENLIPKLDSMLISHHGVNLLRANLQQALSTRYGVTVTTEDAEKILSDGVLYLNGRIMEESRGIIEQLKTLHVKEIINFVKASGLTFNITILSACGGGSILLRNAIQNEFPHVLIDENGIYANAFSMWKIMEAKGFVQP